MEKLAAIRYSFVSAFFFYIPTVIKEPEKSSGKTQGNHSLWFAQPKLFVGSNHFLQLPIFFKLDEYTYVWEPKKKL